MLSFTRRYKNGSLEFIGNDSRITSVARRRYCDSSCRQLPKTYPKAYEMYRVRVTFGNDRLGERCIERIEVSFRGGHWSCFFDESEGKYGDFEIRNTGFILYYLDIEDLEGIQRAYDRYRDRQTLSHLRKKGPRGFPRRRNGI